MLKPSFERPIPSSPIISAFEASQSGPTVRCRAPKARRNSNARRSSSGSDSGATPAAAGRGAIRCRRCSRSSRARGSSKAARRSKGSGLSSLERVELMVALEDQFQTRIDETKFAGAKTLDDLRAVIAAAPQEAEVAEPVDFPSWNRAWPVRIVRRVSQATWILPLARIFAWVRVQRARAPRRHRRAGGVRVESSKPFRRAGDPDGAAGLVARDALRRRCAEGVLQGALLPRGLFGAAGAHQSPELLPVGVLLQHLPAAAARGRRAADAALHRRGDRRRLLGADLPGGRAIARAATSSRSAAASA